MRNIKLIIEYEGTNYCGWQRQEEEKSIQGTIKKAIKDLTGEDIKLIGSGRTDGGVHALGQTANFYTNSTIPDDRFRVCLNIRLPDDIKIIKSEEVDLDFHSRFSAKKKRYRYIIYNNRQPRPLYRNFSYHVYRDLNFEKMERASKYLVGTMDFKSFMANKSKIDTSVRTIYSIDLKKDGDFIYIEILGKSFLRHMIRIIVGTLIYIGLGKIAEDDIIDIIDGKDRSLAGITAPPNGLFLEKVYY